MFGTFVAGGFGCWNVTHEPFGSEAGDFWHGGSFGHFGPFRPQTDRQTEYPQLEEAEIWSASTQTEKCMQDFWKFSSKSKLIWSLFAPVLYHKCIRNPIKRRINFHIIKHLGIVT